MSRCDLIVTRMETTTTTTGSVIAVRFVCVTGPGAESESICVGGGDFKRALSCGCTRKYTEGAVIESSQVRRAH